MIHTLQVTGHRLHVTCGVGEGEAVALPFTGERVSIRTGGDEGTLVDCQHLIKARVAVNDAWGWENGS